MAKVQIRSMTGCLAELSDFLAPTDATIDRRVDLEEHIEYLGEELDSDQLLYRRHVSLTRRKRNILFPSGVQLCPQETYDQAIANHLKYFHLRGMLVLWFPISLHVLFLVVFRCAERPIFFRVSFI